MKKQWAWEAPTEPGWYWFCGTIYGRRIDMEPVMVRGISDGFMYICKNSFLYPDRGECTGVWQGIDMPIIPIEEVNHE